MTNLRVAPSLPATTTSVPQKRAVSLREIEQRTARAAKIEQVFSGIKPGQHLVNAKEYFPVLQSLFEQAGRDYAILYKPGIKVTEPIQKARSALEKQIAILQKIKTVGEAAKIIPTASKPSEKEQFPWEGKLRKGETPLHWAVRNRDCQTARFVRYQMRQQRLATICEYYGKSIKDKKIAASLQKPGLFPKLMAAIDLLHVANYAQLSNQELQEFFKDDPDIAKILLNPDFRKLFKDPQAQYVLNGLDVLQDLDVKNMSPVEEAILQKDPEMTHILLFSHLLANPNLYKLFWSRIQELRNRIETLRKVDPDTLSEVSRAAYLGDKKQLQFLTESELNSPDAKGLTPLHYALLGGHSEAIKILLYDSRCHFYAMTPQGHSYADYAILAGDGGALNALRKFNLPFKLGKEEEKFSYFIASGILNQELVVKAKQKDPLAIWQMDSISGGLNAAWLGAHLFNRWMGIPPEGGSGWISWAAAKFEAGTAHCDDMLATSRIFSIVPSSVAPYVQTASYLNMFVLPLLFGVGSKAFGTSEWPGVIKLFNDYITPVNQSYVMTGYAALRIAAAVKPVLWNKMPIYYDNFRSRPKEVLKNVALDLFNIGTQIFIATVDLPTRWSRSPFTS